MIRSSVCNGRPMIQTYVPMIRFRTISTGRCAPFPAVTVSGTISMMLANAVSNQE
jgi:hypothetical protein